MVLIEVFVCLLALVLFLIGFQVVTRYSERGRSMERLPGPPALPILGHTLRAFNVSLEEMWLLVRRYFKDYYPILRMWKITHAEAFICHADYVKTVLLCKKNIDKPSLYKMVGRGLGNGLIVADGSIWHHRRKIINQAFTPELLEIYSKSVVKQAEKFIADIRCQSSKDVVLNISPIFLNLSLRVAVEGLLGLDLGKFEPDELEEFGHKFLEFSEITMYRAFRPFITDWMMKFLPVGRREAKTIKCIRNMASKVLEERKAYLDNSEKNIVKNNDGVNNKKQCLFLTDVLLRAEKDGLIDRSGMLDETSTMFIAALETSGSQICFVLALLAENKKSQDAVRAEIDKVLSDSGEDRITIHNVKKMEYLDRCIKESIRLLPSIPHISRLITSDVQLGDYKIPSNTELHMSIYDVHRDPNFWSDPEKFDPDRFLPENVERRHRFSYIPFGGGLRICIGQKLAMTQLRILTAEIIHNFVLEPVDLIADQKFQLRITLTSDKIRLKFIEIDRQFN